MTPFLNALPQQSLAPLFRLWQQHRLTLEFHSPFMYIEKLVIHAELEMDQVTHAQIEEVLYVFNGLACTQYELEDILKKRHIKYGPLERAGELEMKAQRLWWLDFGDVDFPVYATTPEEAEYIATVLEQGREKPRLSLTLQEQRREDYAPLLLVCNFVVDRMSKAEAPS